MKLLLELNVGDKAIVKEIEGGHKAQVQLKNLGFYPGIEVSLKKKSSIGGPLMVSIGGSNVAIGRGIASKILVEEKIEQNTTDRAAQLR